MNQTQQNPKKHSSNGFDNLTFADIFRKDPNTEIRFELVHENGKRYTRIIEIKKPKSVNL